MADTVHLYLKLDGVEIQGESTQISLGRANSIECTSLSFDVVEEGGATRTGEIKVAARIDKATPLVVKGLVDKQTADAVFKFFRPSPTGDGTTEQFFTIAGKSGRVRAADMWVPSTLNPATHDVPPMMQYSFSFAEVQETYTNNGLTFGWRT